MSCECSVSHWLSLYYNGKGRWRLSRGQSTPFLALYKLVCQFLGGASLSLASSGVEWRVYGSRHYIFGFGYRVSNIMLDTTECASTLVKVTGRPYCAQLRRLASIERPARRAHQHHGLFTVFRCDHGSGSNPRCGRIWTP